MADPTKPSDRGARWRAAHREQLKAYARAYRQKHGSDLEQARKKGPEAVAAYLQRHREWKKKKAEQKRGGKPAALTGPRAVKLIVQIKPQLVTEAVRRQHPDLSWLIDHVGKIAVRRLRHKHEARRDFAVWSAARDSLPARPVAAEFSDWFEALKNGEHGGTPQSPASLRNIYWRLASLYDTATMLGRTQRNVVREAPEPQGDSRVAAHSWRVVIEGFLRLLASTIDWRERALYTVLRYSGLRIGEVLGLKPEHVILLPGGEVQLQIATQRHRNSALGPDAPLKHDRQRRILPLHNTELVSALLRARRETPSPVQTLGPDHKPRISQSPYLFPFSFTHIIHLQHRLHAVLSALPPGIGWHAFRHAYAAEARLIARATIDELSLWLGHSSPNVTQTYLRSLLGEQPDLNDYSARVAAAQLQKPIAVPASVTEIWPGARPR